jgi:hypothetical protein
MLKTIWLTFLLALDFLAAAQLPHRKRVRQLMPDSSAVIEWSEANARELPVEAVSEAGSATQAIDFIPSPLGASRDVFSGLASFHFGVARFRQRGYDQQCSRVLINGLPMNSIADGTIPWAYWSGLNDATKNSQSFYGPAAIDPDFGSLGNTTVIDMRPFRQWSRTQMGYSFANRSYQHRLSFFHARGFNKHNWSFAAAASFRYGNECYFEGTGTQGGSYYLGADRKLKDGAIVSVVVFGSISANARQSPVVKEIIALTGNYRYNAYWGYQAGKKRNASIATSHVPVCIISYERRIDNHRSLLLSAGMMVGQRAATAPDWYNAADPRPDYYRNLPGYQQDSSLRADLVSLYRSDPGLLQVNWDKLYEVNRNSVETVHDVNGIVGNTVTGLRSHYVLEKRITGISRAGINCVYNSMPAMHLHFAGGFSAQWERRHFFKQIADLLGGEFYVDWNQFAEGDPSVLQNDLDHPNRILVKGDRYGYNYSSLSAELAAWGQLSFSTRHFDSYVAARIGYLNYLREGHVRTGLFPENSLGRSTLHEFDAFDLKAGITCKFDGRRYAFLRATAAAKPPLFSDVFLSPVTRDTEQEDLRPEKLIGAEIGIIHQSPALRCRVSAYYSAFSDGMNLMTFYHDGYRSFVNYALSRIGRCYAGLEAGLEMQLSTRLKLTAALSAGNFVYRGRPRVLVSIDNDDFIAERGVVYLNNYHIGGTPQEAYGLQLSYQSAKGFYANLSGSFFRNHWLDMNPLRRTETGLQQLEPRSVQWLQALEQTRLPDQFSIDLAFGGSVRVRFNRHQRRSVLLYCGIGNLLDQHNFIASGFEQLRFDTDGGDVNRFPPKYFFASGINYSINISLRL